MIVVIDSTVLSGAMATMLADDPSLASGSMASAFRAGTDGITDPDDADGPDVGGVVRGAGLVPKAHAPANRETTIARVDRGG